MVGVHERGKRHIVRQEGRETQGLPNIVLIKRAHNSGAHNPVTAWGHLEWVLIFSEGNISHDLATWSLCPPLKVVPLQRCLLGPVF